MLCGKHAEESPTLTQCEVCEDQKTIGVLSKAGDELNRRLCDMTDSDLAPIKRPQANLWEAKYFESVEECRKANKGIRRLKNKIANAKKHCRDIANEHGRNRSGG